MPYYIHAEDKAGALELRLQVREAHLAYTMQFNDKIIAAGPILGDDGETMLGSVILIDLDDRAEVEAYCAGDPYSKAGVFSQVSIQPFRHMWPKSG
ncbi:MAG: hypothetical protein ACI8P9_002353 [Parasphingorhabdus sp.]|jgi:uncharacterized protein YciI